MTDASTPSSQFIWPRPDYLLGLLLDAPRPQH
jgi:hypothetical protein